MSEFQMSIKRQGQMDRIDAMTPEMKSLVNEFGFAIVDACRQAKVTNAKTIRELVHEIWSGARALGQKKSGIGTLDWVLIQNGANINAETLIGILLEHNYVLVPATPTREMLDASLAEVSGFTVKCTKEEKHRRRLMAAIGAAADGWKRRYRGKSQSISRAA